MKKLICALTCGIALCGSANAALVTFQYSAVVVDTVTSDASGYNWDASLINGFRTVVGNNVRGTFSYDTATPVWFQWKPQATYYLGDGGMSLDVVENGFSFLSTSADIPQKEIFNDFREYGENLDSFGISSHTFAQNKVPPLVATFSLFDYTGTALATNQLPAQLDLSRFQQNTVVMDYNFGDNWSQFTANVTSLELVSDVPEPTTTASFVTGLLMLLASGRFRTRNSSLR